MKELSIEEKAKAYDRVSKEVKDFFKGRQKMYSDVSQTLKYLFPELKESEDEKIVNAIRKALESKIEDLGNGVTRTACLAWLEKQATPQMVEDAFLKGCNDTKKCLLKRQSEQKSTEILKWSAQEEYCICELEAMVREAWRKAENVHNNITIKKMQELMFFLKTLNPNKKPQRMISAEAKEAMYDKPACAWSEEDEKMFKSLKTLLNDASCYSCTEGVDKILAWLKQKIG